MKKQVIDAFSQAVHYQEHAHVQRRVAHTLADSFPSLSRPVVLELGCGTGFLSQRLLAEWPDGRFVLSDIAEPMLQRCRAHLGERAGLHYVVLDGEQPAVGWGYDLIAASMVLQWFDDPLGALLGLRGLLRPGGYLLMATLGPESFQEWRRACAEWGMPHGLPGYPTLADWRGAWPASGGARLWEERIVVQHPSALAFLRALRAVGAHLPVSGYRPQPVNRMRRLLRGWEGGFSITYHVLYGVFAVDGS